MYNKVSLLGFASPPEFIWNDVGELVAILSVITTEKCRSLHDPVLRISSRRHRVIVIGKRAALLRRRMQGERSLFIEGQLTHGTFLEDGHRRSGAEIYITPSSGTIRFVDDMDRQLSLAEETPLSDGPEFLDT